MSTPAHLALALTLALGLCPGCKRSPKGACPFDLGGVWVNASDSRYAYRLTDRGEEISGEAFLRDPSGKPQAGAPIAFRLTRGRAEVAGEMKSPANAPSGKPCTVGFSMKITSCEPSKLQVQSELSAPVDESCKRLSTQPDGGAIPPDVAEFVWVRPSTD